MYIPEADLQRVRYVQSLPLSSDHGQNLSISSPESAGIKNLRVKNHLIRIFLHPNWPDDYPVSNF